MILKYLNRPIVSYYFAYQLLEQYLTFLYFSWQALRKQIETLREIKSDREEVADALRDKAGLGALNGLVSLQQFDAVRGDIEKRIVSAYDKFNSQEMIWQVSHPKPLPTSNRSNKIVTILSASKFTFKYRHHYLPIHHHLFV